MVFILSYSVGLEYSVPFSEEVKPDEAVEDPLLMEFTP